MFYKDPSDFPSFYNDPSQDAPTEQPVELWEFAEQLEDSDYADILDYFDDEDRAELMIALADADVDALLVLGDKVNRIVRSQYEDYLNGR